MLVNYRPYYRKIFTSVTTLAEEKIDVQKERKLFLLDKSNKFQNKYKVNIIKQQNIVLLYIARGIKSPTMSIFIYFVTKLILTIIKLYCSGAPRISQLNTTLIYFCIRLWIEVMQPYVILYCVVINRLRRKPNIWNTQQMEIRY